MALSSTFIFLTLISVGHGRSLMELFDNSAKVCNLYVGTFMLYNGFTVVSSCGMAVYRLLCVKWNLALWEKHGQYRVMWSIIFAEVFLFVAMAFLYVVLGFKASKKGAARSFCRGTSTTYLGIIREYETGDQAAKQGLGVQTGILAILLVLLIVEVACYFVIFCDCIKQNKSMVGKLNATTIKSRNKTNAITMTGQVLTFLMESSAFVTIAAILNYSNLNLEPASFPMFLSFITALTSVTLLMASPELKRHYKIDVR